MVSGVGQFLLLPHIEEALNNLAWTLCNFMHPKELPEWDGELYIHGESFETIHSIVSRTTNIHPDFHRMEYHLFDVVHTDKPQIERLAIFTKIKEYVRPPLRITPVEICNTLDEIIEVYRNYVSIGYEGIIVRHLYAPYTRKRSIYMMKFKPKKKDRYPVVGYKEEMSINGEPKGRLGAVICEKDGEQFSVGTGFTDIERELYWAQRDKLIGQICEVEYQCLTAKRKVPKFHIDCHFVANRNEGV
jgi:ATP-dependent DNA ligase